MYSVQNHVDIFKFKGDGEHSENLAYIRICIPAHKIQKCLTYSEGDTIYTIKKRYISSLHQPLEDELNYGLYLPPGNGYIGGFLNEQILVSKCNFSDSTPYLELRYKRRVYRDPKTNVKLLKEINSMPKQKRFMSYVKKGTLAKVKRMCDKGLDPNFHDSITGETPLSIATKILDPSDLLETLVKGGSHIDFRNKLDGGLTALHVAAGLGKAISIKKLLELGASTCVRDSNNLTPFYYFVVNSQFNSNMIQGGDPLCTRLLIYDGNSPLGICDNQEWQEIHQVCRLGHYKILEILLSRNVDANARNASGNTPLHICGIHNQVECANLLLRYGAKLNSLNLANQNPADVAVIASNHSLASYLTMIKEKTNLSSHISSPSINNNDVYRTMPMNKIYGTVKYPNTNNSECYIYPTPNIHPKNDQTDNYNNNWLNINNSTHYQESMNGGYVKGHHENQTYINTYQNTNEKNIMGSNHFTYPLSSIRDGPSSQNNSEETMLGLSNTPHNNPTSEETIFFQQDLNIEKEVDHKYNGGGSISNYNDSESNTYVNNTPLNHGLLNNEDKNSSSITSGKGSSLNSEEINGPSSDHNSPSMFLPCQSPSPVQDHDYKIEILQDSIKPNTSLRVDNPLKNLEIDIMENTLVGLMNSTSLNHKDDLDNPCLNENDQYIGEFDRNFSNNDAHLNNNTNVNPYHPPPPPDILARCHANTLSNKSLSSQDVATMDELVNRFVILHKGETGYGFVLSGPKLPPQNNVCINTFGPKSSNTRFENWQHVILSVDEYSPASQAGLKPGDHVLDVNDVRIEFLSHAQVSTLISKTGVKLTMTVLTKRVGFIPLKGPIVMCHSKMELKLINNRFSSALNLSNGGRGEYNIKSLPTRGKASSFFTNNMDFIGKKTIPNGFSSLSGRRIQKRFEKNKYFRGESYLSIPERLNTIFDIEEGSKNLNATYGSLQSNSSSAMNNRIKGGGTINSRLTKKFKPHLAQIMTGSSSENDLLHLSALSNDLARHAENHTFDKGSCRLIKGQFVRDFRNFSHSNLVDASSCYSDQPPCNNHNILSLGRNFCQTFQAYKNQKNILLNPATSYSKMPDRYKKRFKVISPAMYMPPHYINNVEQNVNPIPLSNPPQSSLGINSYYHKDLNLSQAPHIISQPCLKLNNESNISIVRNSNNPNQSFNKSENERCQDVRNLKSKITSNETHKNVTFAPTDSLNTTLANENFNDYYAYSSQIEHYQNVPPVLCEIPPPPTYNAPVPPNYRFSVYDNNRDHFAYGMLNFNNNNNIDCQYPKVVERIQNYQILSDLTETEDELSLEIDKQLECAAKNKFINQKIISQEDSLKPSCSNSINDDFCRSYSDKNNIPIMSHINDQMQINNNEILEKIKNSPLGISSFKNKFNIKENLLKVLVSPSPKVAINDNLKSLVECKKPHLTPIDTPTGLHEPIMPLSVHKNSLVDLSENKVSTEISYSTYSTNIKNVIEDIQQPQSLSIAVSKNSEKSLLTNSLFIETEAKLDGFDKMVDTSVHQALLMEIHSYFNKNGNCIYTDKSNDCTSKSLEILKEELECGKNIIIKSDVETKDLIDFENDHQIISPKEETHNKNRLSDNLKRGTKIFKDIFNEIKAELITPNLKKTIEYDDKKTGDNDSKTNVTNQTDDVIDHLNTNIEISDSNNHVDVDAPFNENVIEKIDCKCCNATFDDIYNKNIQISPINSPHNSLHQVENRYPNAINNNHFDDDSSGTVVYSVPIKCHAKVLPSKFQLKNNSHFYPNDTVNDVIDVREDSHHSTLYINSPDYITVNNIAKKSKSMTYKLKEGPTRDFKKRLESMHNDRFNLLKKQLTRATDQGQCLHNKSDEICRRYLFASAKTGMRPLNVYAGYDVEACEMIWNEQSRQHSNENYEHAQRFDKEKLISKNDNHINEKITRNKHKHESSNDRELDKEEAFRVSRKAIVNRNVRPFIKDINSNTKKILGGKSHTSEPLPRIRFDSDDMSRSLSGLSPDTDIIF
ncbi:unnamed protein product [Gordionus sp. m RMFG-2023]|uniref:uncharacterized protein LOC135926317 isoform X2 n=1 Tax=Gordionus sp. m RMFG-2023 TaxID=3053472 RepID=UPI0030E2A543